MLAGVPTWRGGAVSLEFPTAGELASDDRMNAQSSEAQHDRLRDGRVGQARGRDFQRLALRHVVLGWRACVSGWGPPPPPPTSFGVDDATLDAMWAMAHGDDATRTSALRAMWGDRLSESWIRFKVERWRARADPHAVAGYVRMFAQDGLPDPNAAIAVPVLAVTGEQDGEHMRHAAVHVALTPLCDPLEVVAIADAGHYPMQETPPLLVSILERFLVDEHL